MAEGYTCISLLLVNLFTLISGDLYLDKLSTLYLPFNYYKNGTAQFGYDEGAIEQLTYDPKEKIIYTAGENIIQVVDLTDVRNPTVVSYRIFKDSSEITDIEYCDGYVIVTRKDGVRKERGYVNIYRKYNKHQRYLKLLKTIVVGSGPDDIKATSDCRKILIAIEGEVYNRGSRLIDPLGGVGVISFRTRDLSKPHVYRMVDFTSFNDRAAELVRNGTRYVFRSPDNTIAHDLEPETITLNDDETTAYISLQENNAIAEFDMRTNSITAIHPLGFKNWKFSRLDASDKDRGINIRPWPVFGMYQPDTIRFMNLNGRGFIVSANEGDSKDFSGDVPNGFNEEARARDLTLTARSPVRTWAKANGFGKTLLAPRNLGRLQVTNLDGRRPNSNKYRHLFTFGTRSFSIWRARDMRQLYDSGSDFEDAISRFRPSIFNSDAGDDNAIAASTADSKSDNKGPEPESIEIGEYDGKKLIFIGFEEPGGILVYSVKRNVRQPKFEDIWVGVTEPRGTWKEMYDRRAVSDLDVESLRFVHQLESPIGEPLLIASGSISGTVSIFQIKNRSVGFTCVGKPTGLYVDPADCNKYYNCHEGTQYKMSCPAGLHFNQERGFCDWPENVAC